MPGPQTTVHTIRAIQGTIDRLDTFLDTVGLTLLLTKSKALLFNTRVGAMPGTTFLLIKGHIIPWSQEAKYLGLLIDSHLT